MVRSAELDTYRAQAKIPSEKFKRLMGCYGSQLTSHKRKKAHDDGAESSLGWKKPWEHKKSTSFFQRKVLRKNFNLSEYPVSLMFQIRDTRQSPRRPREGVARCSTGCLLLFSRSVVSDSSWPHQLQHTRLPCASPSPGACMRAKLLQSCLTLCNPMDCSPPGSSVHGGSPGKNTRMGCHALLQGIFQTQGSNPGLPHCRQVLYRLSHQGSPAKIINHKQYSLSRESTIANVTIAHRS